MTETNYDDLLAQLPKTQKVPRGESGYDDILAGTVPIRDFPQPARSGWDIGQDITGSLLRGGNAVIGGVVGLSEAIPGMQTGKWLEQGLGYSADSVDKALKQNMSPAQQWSEAAIDEAEGFGETAKAFVDNPSNFLMKGVEQIPNLLSMAGMGRKLLMMAPSMAPGTAAAISEGLLATGMSLEGMRQEGADVDMRQRVAATAAGFTTGMITKGLGKLQSKYGFDPDTMFLPSPTGGVMASPLWQRALVGGVGESIEEGLQGIPEQIAQNWGMRQENLFQGIGENVAQGMLTAGPMGAMGGAIGHVGGKREAQRINNAIDSVRKAASFQKRMGERELLEVNGGVDPLRKMAEEMALREATPEELQKAYQQKEQAAAGTTTNSDDLTEVSSSEWDDLAKSLFAAGDEELAGVSTYVKEGRESAQVATDAKLPLGERIIMSSTAPGLAKQLLKTVNELPAGSVTVVAGDEKQYPRAYMEALQDYYAELGKEHGITKPIMILGQSFSGKYADAQGFYKYFAQKGGFHMIIPRNFPSFFESGHGDALTQVKAIGGATHELGHAIGNEGFLGRFSTISPEAKALVDKLSSDRKGQRFNEADLAAMKLISEASGLPDVGNLVGEWMRLRDGVMGTDESGGTLTAEEFAREWLGFRKLAGDIAIQTPTKKSLFREMRDLERVLGKKMESATAFEWVKALQQQKGIKPDVILSFDEFFAEKMSRWAWESGSLQASALASPGLFASLMEKLKGFFKQVEQNFSKSTSPQKISDVLNSQSDRAFAEWMSADSLWNAEREKEAKRSASAKLPSTPRKKTKAEVKEAISAPALRAEDNALASSPQGAARVDEARGVLDAFVETVDHLGELNSEYVQNVLSALQEYVDSGDYQTVRLTTKMALRTIDEGIANTYGRLDADTNLLPQLSTAGARTLEEIPLAQEKWKTEKWNSPYWTAWVEEGKKGVSDDENGNPFIMESGKPIPMMRLEGTQSYVPSEYGMWAVRGQGTDIGGATIFDDSDVRWIPKEEQEALQPLATAREIAGADWDTSPTLQDTAETRTWLGRFFHDTLGDMAASGLAWFQDNMLQLNQYMASSGDGRAIRIYNQLQNMEFRKGELSQGFNDTLQYMNKQRRFNAGKVIEALNDVFRHEQDGDVLKFCTVDENGLVDTNLSELPGFLQKRGVSHKDALLVTELYGRFRQNFVDQFMELGEAMKSRALAVHRGYPELLAEDFRETNALIDKLVHSPFMPRNTTGEFVLQIKEGKDIIYREFFSSRRDMEKAQAEYAKYREDGWTIRAENLSLAEQQAPYFLPGDSLPLLERVQAPGAFGRMQEFMKPTVARPVAKRFERINDKIDGASPDFVGLISQYASRTAGYIAKMEYSAPIKQALADYADRMNAPGADFPTMSRMHDKLRDTFDYMMNPPAEFTRARGFISQLFLMGSAKSAVMNFGTQTNTIAAVGGIYGEGAGIRAYIEAWKQIAGFKGLAQRVKDGDAESIFVSELIDMATKEGFLDQSYAYYLANNSTLEAWSPLWRKNFNSVAHALAELGMLPFRVVEKGNRLSTLLTFALAERERNPGVSLQEAFALGRAQTDLLQGSYTKVNKAPFMRGRKGLLTCLLSYTQQQCWIMLGGYERAMNKQGAKIPFSRSPTLKLWGAFLALAGASGAPFGEDLLDVIDIIGQKFSDQFFSSRTLVREVAQGVGLDPQLAMHGLLGNVGGFNLAGSFGLGKVIPGIDLLNKRHRSFADFTADTVKSVGGPAGSAFNSIGGLIFNTWEGKPMEGLKAMPGMVGALSKALDWSLADEANEPGGSVRAKDGSRLTWDQELGQFRDLSGAELLGQALGFHNALVGENKERRWEIKSEYLYWQAERSGQMSMAKRALREGLWEEGKEILAEWNKRVPVKELIITPKQVSQAIRREKQVAAKMEDFGISTKAGIALAKRRGTLWGRRAPPAVEDVPAEGYDGT